MDANRYCFNFFLMNIVISTSSLYILITMSSSSTITGINYIMTLVLLIISYQHDTSSYNYLNFYIQQHKQPVWIPVLVL